MKSLLQTCKATNCILMAHKNYAQIVNIENNVIIYSSFSIKTAKNQQEVDVNGQN